MSQSRTQSLIESLTNVGVGFVISLLSQLIIFKHFDIHLSLDTNVVITLYFTVISIARSYMLRRWFGRRG